MEIVFTNKFKDLMLHSTGGIKFALKGYLFYTNSLSNIGNLTFNDLKKNYILANEYKNDNNIYSRTFDMTYIPSLEGTLTEGNNSFGQFGTYSIKIDKSFFKSFPVEIKHIIIIGEELSETNSNVDILNKEYIAAVIDIDYNLSEENEFSPRKIFLQLNMSDIDSNVIPKVQVDDNFNEITLSEKQENIELISLSDKFVLNADQDQYLEGAVNVPGNITLLDNTHKISNNWNMKPRVVIGLDSSKKTPRPQIELIDGDNSLSMAYKKNKYFSLSNNEGNDNIKIDILNKNPSEINSDCYFRMKTIDSIQADSTHVFEFGNIGSTIENEKYSSIIESNNIVTDSCEENLYLNSTNNNVENYNDFISIDSHNINLVPNSGKNSETIAIGVSGLYNTLDTLHTSNNITFIGNNKNSTYATYEKEEMIELDDIWKEKGYFTWQVPGSTGFLQVTGTVDIGLDKNDYDSQELGNQALIGFGGLTVNKIPNMEKFYSDIKEIGINPDTGETEYYYFGTVASQQNKNFSVVFGNYNANENIKGLSGFDRLGVNSAMAFNGLPANYVDDKFRSYCNYNFTYTTNPSESTSYYHYANLFHLFFNHTQDTIFNGLQNTEWQKLSADEGDFGLNKIVVVGNGEKFTDQNVTGYSPAEFASKYTDYSDNCYRINLFSIEKDSFQLVHHNTYDINPHYSATDVVKIDSMFAVRGIEDVYQKYSYRFKNNIPYQYENINKYNLQNAVYTPSIIYMPLGRSSNDLYKLNLKNLMQFATNNTRTLNLKVEVSVDDMNMDSIEDINATSFVINITSMNGKTSFDLYDIVSYLRNTLDVDISIDGNTGSDKNTYSIFVVNSNPSKQFNVNCFRLKSNGQRQEKTFNIPVGGCLKIDYMNDGIEGLHGMLNIA